MAESMARVGYKNAQNQFEALNIAAADVVAADGTSAQAHISDGALHLTTTQSGQIAGAVQAAQLGQPGGVATLDGNGRVEAAQIPDGIMGAMIYRGTFDPETGLDYAGAPIPEPAAENKGWYWIATNSASWTPPGSSAPIVFVVGCWLVSNGDSFDIITQNVADALAREIAQNAQTAANNAQGTANTALDNAATAQSAASNAASAAGAAQNTANTALQTAQMLDAAFVASETEMQALNLRTGAIVFMAV